MVDTDVQGFPTLDDQSMNGSNGSPLVIEYPEDRLGPAEDAPTRTFYIYAPVLHWHQSPTTDESARRAIEQLADEAFRFGQQTEHHEQMLLDGQQAVEAYVKEFRTAQDQENSQLWDQVQRGIKENQSLKDELTMMRVQHSNDYKLLHAELEAKVQQMTGQINTAGQRIVGLQREVEQTKKMMISTAREATEFALTPIRTSLEQLGKEMTELTEAKIDMQAKIQQLTEQLDQAKDTVGDAVEVRLARLEKAQEGLMSVIENLTAEMGSGQDEEDNEEPEASPRLSASVPLVSPPHGEMHGPSILQMFPIADSVKSHQRSKEEKGKFVDPLGGEDKGPKGDVSAKVQTDRPTYTMHSGPPLPSYIATTGGAGTSGATSAPQVGAAEVKVDPPARYSGARVPGVRSWLTQMERWMVLRNYPVDKYVAVVANQTEGAAQAWINQVLQDIEVGKRNPFDDWADFKVAMCAAFEPVTATEESRRQLRNLRQTGRVRAYVQRFRELQYRLPGMSEEEAFSTFLAGLTPHIQEQVGAHIQGDLSAAITMAERLDLFRASAREGGGSSGGAQQKGQRGGSAGKKKGLVHSVEEKKEGTSEVAFVKEKGKQKQRKGSAGKKKGKSSVRCYNCGGNHFLRNCKEWQEARKRLKNSGKE